MVSWCAMPEPDLQAIRARADAATPGPWYADDGGVYAAAEAPPYRDVPLSDWTVTHQAAWRDWEEDAVLLFEGGAHDAESRDAEFVAHARHDVDALVGRVEELAAALTEVLSEFYKGHPGGAWLRTGWVRVGTVARWRAALHPQEPSE